MYQFKKLMITLDLSSMDDLLIDYVSFLANKIKPDKVIFMHVMETMYLPEEVSSMFSDLDEPIDQIIKKELDQNIKDNYYGPEDTQTELRVREGNPTDIILREAESEKIDLVVLGKKTGFKGKGILTGKIVRLIHCSSLILPESGQPKLDKILVPVDFSKYSQMALKQAMKLSEDSNAEVVCQHVYNIPVHYYPYISSTAKMDKPMLEHAAKEYDKFLKKVAKPKPKIRCEYTKDEGQDISQKIYDLAVKERANLIVVGSKGLTNTASFLIGSTAEKLTSYDKTIPLLIFKDKEENFGLLDILFNR